jgi:hypothetical protein
MGIRGSRYWWNADTTSVHYHVIRFREKAAFKMKTMDPVQSFSQMTKDDKTRFLCRLAFELTIVARDTYIPQTEELSHPAQLRAINELQHRILGYLNALSFDDTKRYPDDVLVAIIMEAGKDEEQRRRVRDTFDRLLSSFG